MDTEHPVTEHCPSIAILIAIINASTGLYDITRALLHTTKSDQMMVFKFKPL